MSDEQFYTGIELGERAVTVARIKLSLGVPEFAGTRTVEIPAGGDYAAKASAALRAAAGAAGSRSVRASAVMPDGELLFVNMMLPSSNPAELPAMAALAMDQRAPLGPAALNTTYHVIENGGTGGAIVGISAARRDSVDALVSICAAAGINVRTVTSAGIAAARYFAPLVGVGKTLLALHCGARGVSAHLISRAGLLMTHYETTGGNSGTALDSAVRAARIVTEQVAAPAPSRAMLFGAGPRPDAWALKSALGIEVETSAGGEYPGGVADAQLAAGAALELAPEFSTGANLLKAASGKSAGAGVGRLIPWLAAAAFAVALLSLVAHGLSMQRARAAELRRVTQQLDSMKPDQSRISKQKTLLSAYSVLSSNDAAALDILKELSTRLPAGVYVTNMVFEKGKSVSLTGETSGQDKVASVIAALEQSAAFSDVQLAYSRQSDEPGGAIVTFEAKATLRELPSR